jgi:hypothetical protein
MPLELHVHDVVHLRKPHPCGGYEWEITRVGADIGIKCTTCAHRVMLPRREFERRLKTFVRRGADLAQRPEAEPPEPRGSAI